MALSVVSPRPLWENSVIDTRPITRDSCMSDSSKQTDQPEQAPTPQQALDPQQAQDLVQAVLSNDAAKAKTLFPDTEFIFLKVNDPEADENDHLGALTSDL